MPILYSNVRPLPFTDNGTGGMPFAYQPPSPGFALVGLVIRAGNWIDQVTPIFAEMLEDGSTGPEFHGPSFGGQGGFQREVLRVAEGHVVTGFQTRSGNYVDAMRLLQTRWDGSSLQTADSKWTPWAGASSMGGVERMERIADPEGGAIAIGIAGRSGGYIDNLSLICAQIVRVSGTAVARGSGRHSRSSVAAG